MMSLSPMTILADGKTDRNLENAEPSTQSVTSTITTYNMAAGIGVDGEYDLEGIADTLRSMEADIIGLQEVDVHWGSRSDYENTVEKLAEKLDMEYYFAPIYDDDPLEEGEPRRQYGVAVLSKYPIVSAYNREITRLSTQDPDPTPKLAPGFLEAQIDVEGEDLWFYVTHLDYRGDSTVREMQIEDMFQVMNEHPYNILVGDLNATPDAQELEPLFQSFYDVWNISGDHLGYTFPADEPEKRIDYILTTPRIEVEQAYTTDSIASDHLPVTAEITLSGQHSESIEEMKSLTEKFIDLGWINEQSEHILALHLMTLNHYEKQNDVNKLVKHLGRFQILLDAQYAENKMTERAYQELSSDIDRLIEKWSDE